MVFKKKRKRVDVKSITPMPINFKDMDARIRENDRLREEIKKLELEREISQKFATFAAEFKVG